MSTATTPSASRPASTDARWFEPLIGLVALTILVQALIAGIFIDDRAGDGVISVHGGIADASWALALVATVYAFVRVRRQRPLLWWATLSLLVLDLIQTGIGHLITDHGQDWLITVHVPLALALFGLALWLSLQSSRLRGTAR